MAAVQKSLSRRVSFSDTHRNADLEPPKPVAVESGETGEGRFNSGYNTCCAWASIAAGAIILAVVVLGIAFFGFLRTSLPKFQFQGLDVSKLDVVTSRSQGTLLNSDLEVHLNATNNNGAIELKYGPMAADVSSGGVSLGKTRIPAITQKPRTSVTVDVKTRVSKAAVDEMDAKQLKSDSKQHAMVMGVVLKGAIDFRLKGRKVIGFPFQVWCLGIEQSAIDSGLTPSCNVKITIFR